MLGSPRSNDGTPKPVGTSNGLLLDSSADLISRRDGHGSDARFGPNLIRQSSLGSNKLAGGFCSVRKKVNYVGPALQMQVVKRSSWFWRLSLVVTWFPPSSHKHAGNSDEFSDVISK